MGIFATLQIVYLCYTLHKKFTTWANYHDIKQNYKIWSFL